MSNIFGAKHSTIGIPVPDQIRGISFYDQSFDQVSIHGAVLQ